MPPEVPEDIRNLLRELSLNGGLEKTRTSDLFRVNLAEALLLLLNLPGKQIGSPESGGARGVSQEWSAEPRLRTCKHFECA